jgi:hypothetical protein
MKTRLIVSFLLLTLLLASCQPATPPPPLTASVGTEFILAPGQSALIEEADLTLTLLSVSNDERCPSEIECFASGPVTLTISAQKGSREPTEFILQTFTDYKGQSPKMEFEGIQDRVTFEGYQIKVASVLPYPAKSTTEIADADYRVSLLVTLE